MTAHEPFEELLAAEALGILDSQEGARLDAHLRDGCAVCPLLRRRFRTVTAALGRLPVPETPSLYVRDRLLRAIPPASATFDSRSPLARKPWYGWGAGSVAVAFTLIALLWIPRSHGLSAHVVRTEGSLRVSGKSAGLKDRIGLNQPISTGEGASADLRIGDVAMLRLGPATEATLTRQGNAILVKLESGSLFCHVKTGTAYAVATAQVSAEARGTTFMMKIDSPQSTYVCICQGHLHLVSPDHQQELASDHHLAVTVSDRAEQTVVLPDHLRDHLDSPPLEPL